MRSRTHKSIHALRWVQLRKDFLFIFREYIQYIYIYVRIICLIYREVSIKFIIIKTRLLT